MRACHNLIYYLLAKGMALPISSIRRHVHEKSHFIENTVVQWHLVVARDTSEAEPAIHPHRNRHHHPYSDPSADHPCDLLQAGQ